MYVLQDLARINESIVYDYDHVTICLLSLCTCGEPMEAPYMNIRACLTIAFKFACALGLKTLATSAHAYASIYTTS